MKVTERGMVVDRKATVNQSTTRYKRSLNSNMKFISHRITKTGQQQIRKNAFTGSQSSRASMVCGQRGNLDKQVTNL